MGPRKTSKRSTNDAAFLIAIPTLCGITEDDLCDEDEKEDDVGHVQAARAARLDEAPRRRALRGDAIGRRLNVVGEILLKEFLCTRSMG